jgi:hypothetical protein
MKAITIPFAGTVGPVVARPHLALIGAALIGFAAGWGAGRIGLGLTTALRLLAPPSGPASSELLPPSSWSPRVFDDVRDTRPPDAGEPAVRPRHPKP